MPRALALLALVASCLVVAAPAAAAPEGADKTAVRFSGIEQHGRALGNPEAPVTISFFHHLRCPFCREFDRTILPKLIKRYVRTGTVRIIAYPMAFPLGDDGKDSRAGARYALAIERQNVYWNFIDLFYANQGDELTSYTTDQFLFELTSAIPGSDAQRALTDRKSAAVANEFKQITRRAERLGVNGVPTLHVAATHARGVYSSPNHTDLNDIRRAIIDAAHAELRARTKRNQ
jgi:protein-disulfide isomerase